MSQYRVLSNTGWILLGSGFNKVSSIVLLYILSRYLGAEGFGRFSFAFFYATFFSSIAEFGLTPILIKYVNEYPKKAGEVQGKGIIVGLIFTGAAILLAYGGAFMLNYEADIRYLILIASLTLLISFRDVTFRWILEVPFRASLKMAYPALIGILSECLGLASILFIIYKEGSIEAIITVYVLSSLPGFFILLLLSVRFIRPSFRGGSISTYNIIQEAIPIGASNILSIIYLVIGSLILFQFKGAKEVGYYALAFRLTTSLRIIPEAMMHSLFPLLTIAHLNEPQRGKSIFGTAIRYGALAAFPLTIGTMAVAQSVVVLMSGKGFLPAAAALSILIWATFFAFFNTILRFIFNAISLQRYNFWISVSMVISSVILSFLFIPKQGFMGASYALVFSEAIGLLFSLIIARPYELMLPIKIIGKYLIASFVMAVVIWFLPFLAIQIPVGALVYLIVAFVIGGIEKEDILKLFYISKVM